MKKHIGLSLLIILFSFSAAAESIKLVKLVETLPLVQSLSFDELTQDQNDLLETLMNDHPETQALMEMIKDHSYLVESQVTFQGTQAAGQEACLELVVLEEVDQALSGKESTFAKIRSLPLGCKKI